tara:strand:- start:196 stop:525 length:330 start_codon:yes stop_codon:yes gene_type:complete
MEAKTVTHEEFNKIRLYSNTVSLVVAMVTALGVGFGFYYNTKTTLESNTIEIKDIKDEVKGIMFQIQDIEVYKGVSSTELENLDEKVNDIQTELTTMDLKLDKIIATLK